MTVVNEQTKDVTFSYTCKKYDKYSAANDDRATSVASPGAWRNIGTAS